MEQTGKTWIYCTDNSEIVDENYSTHNTKHLLRHCMADLITYLCSNKA